PGPGHLARRGMPGSSVHAAPRCPGLLPLPRSRDLGPEDRSPCPRWGYRGERRRSPRFRSNIEVERELPGMRTEPHRIDLILTLVLEPRLDDVGREHVALEQPVVRLLEVVEHDREIARQLLDLL